MATAAGGRSASGDATATGGGVAAAVAERRIGRGLGGVGPPGLALRGPRPHERKAYQPLPGALSSPNVGRKRSQGRSSAEKARRR